MRPLFVIFALLMSASAFAQPEEVTQAVINTTTTVIAPETEDVQNIQGSPGGGMQMFRNFGDGETKSVTTIKDSMIKTVLKNDMGRTTIIRNTSSKLTTTLLEIMGNKTGFYITDEEQAVLKIRMDSMMQSRRDKDTTLTRPAVPASTVPPEIIYTEETKRIAGYDCKKALVITTRLLGIKDTIAVWFTPQLKNPALPSTGGTSSFSSFGNFGNFTSLNGLDKINGFVMYYEMIMRRGRRMIVEVTKIDLKKEITLKEFEIPKDFDLKPMKEFQNMMQGGMQQFRMERQ
jgi:GLPGLI family protein